MYIYLSDTNFENSYRLMFATYTIDNFYFHDRRSILSRYDKYIYIYIYKYPSDEEEKERGETRSAGSRGCRLV